MAQLFKFIFDSKTPSKLIPSFRGAIIKAMGDNAHPLMHNHEEDGVRFGYPQVQYKIIDGYPAIISMDEVGAALSHYFDNNKEITLNIRGKKRLFTLSANARFDYTPAFEDAPKYYAITNYLPLTNDNVEEYDSLLALTDKICLIENILTGNILSFFKGIGYHATEHIVCVVTSIDRQSIIPYKGVHFRAFDLHFVSNVELPDFIGLGKSTSIGMGTIQRETLPDQFKNFMHEKD